MSSSSSSSTSESTSPLLSPTLFRLSSEHELEQQSEELLCSRLRAVGIDIEEGTKTTIAHEGIGDSSSSSPTIKSSEGGGVNDEGYHSRTSTISSSSTVPEEVTVRDARKKPTSLKKPRPPVFMVDVPDNWLSSSSSKSADEAGGKEQQPFMRTTMKRRKRLSLALEDEAEDDSEIFCGESQALIPMIFPPPLSPLDKLRKTVAEHTGMHFIFPDTQLKGNNKNNNRKKAQSAKLHRRRQSAEADLYWQMLLQALKDTGIL